LKKNIYWTILILFLPFAFFAAIFFCCKGAGAGYFENGTDSIAAAERIVVLTGEDYEGRQFGTPGGKKASEYIKGVLRGQGIKSFNKEGYGMGIDATTAVFESAEFKIPDAIGGSFENFEILKDYNPITKGFGGGIDYIGDVLLAEGPIEDIPGYMLVGRVVAAKSGNVSEQAQTHVIKSGGEGILFYDENETRRFEIERKSVDASGKHSETVFIARINGGVYEKLLERSENGFHGIAEGVEIHVKIGFPYLNGENIIGYIPADGSEECLIFAAGYDGYGSYGENSHVPGTIDNAGGVAGLLEISGKFGSMDSVPEKNIVFLFFDGGKSGNSGIEDYIENPLFPIDKTEVVILDKLGWKNSEKTWIAYGAEDRSSERLAKMIFKNYENAGLEAMPQESGLGENQKSLHEMGMPTVAIGSVKGSDFEAIGGSPKDNGGQWDASNFEGNLKGCLDFAASYCYGSLHWGHWNMGVVIFASVLIAFLYASYAASVLYRRHPGASIGKRTIRKIYYSLPRILADRFAGLLISVSTAIAVIVLASNIRFWEIVSLKAAFEGVYSFIRNFEPGGIYNLIDDRLVFSAALAASSTAFAFIAGIAIGTLRGANRAKESNGRGMFSLAALSIPHAFWVLGLLYVSILCFGNAAHSGGGFEHSLKTLVLPFVSIALIPLLCLSHLVESFVIKEMDKDYVIAAKARGFASFEIASRHMIKGILAEAAKHIPEITVMVLSNLIAVEYIFGLPGLMNRLVVDIKNPETVFGIMLMTGAFCTVSVVFSKVFNSLLSPKGGCLHEE